MGTRLSAGESLVVGCLVWLVVIFVCVAVATVLLVARLAGP
jgi:hypothetical protein